MNTKRSPAEQNVVSFKLDAFTAGGFMPEGDYLLTRHEVVLWDYDGKLSGNTLALRVSAQPVTISPNGQIMTESKSQEVVQHYSIGDPTAFGPDESGTKIVALAKRATLGSGSNFFIYLQNMINSGFPEDRYDNDVSVFDGTVAHLAHIPMPERNIPKSKLVAVATAVREWARTIVVATVIHKLPWEKVARRSAAAPVSKAKGAAPVAVVEKDAAPSSVEDLLKEHLASVLGGSGKLARTQARVGIFKSMNSAGVDPKLRDEALKAFNDDEDLASVLADTGDGYSLEGKEIVPVG